MLDLGDKQSFVTFLRAPQLRTLAHRAIASTMPADSLERGADACFELKCSSYQLKGAMLGLGRERSVYKLSFRQLTAADIEGLEKAAESKAQVRLVFSDGSIVLADIKPRRLGDGWTSIEGRLVGTRSSGRT